MDVRDELQPHSAPHAAAGKLARPPSPYARMEKRKDALDRLDLRFRWGGYGIHVLHCHLARFPPGHLIPFHCHSEFEFHFIPQGRGKLTLEHAEFELQAGMFYLTGPGVLHQQWSDPDDPMAELCLHCEIVPLDEAVRPGQWGAGIEDAEAAECVRILQQCPAEPVADRFQAMGCFLRAYRVWEEQTVGFYTSLKQEIIQILLRAARAFAPSEGGGTIPERDMTAHRTQLAVQYMEDNAARPITLEEVAAAVGVSARQLQRVLSSGGGEPFRKRLEDIRLAGVCRDLLHSPGPVEEIAIRNGFPNPNYLYPVFKQKFGVTPAVYRQQHARLKK